MNKKSKENLNNSKPTFWVLFWFFLKISILSFGGGNAAFPLIKNYCVDKKGWITNEEIDEILMITNSIPGPSIVEAIVYISQKLLNSKWKAALVTMLSLLPHTILFFVIFYVSSKYIPMEYLKVIYVAIIPIIIALLLNMTFRYIKSDRKQIPVFLHWMIFAFTLTFTLFVPMPWSIPIFVITFLAIVLLIVAKIQKHKNKNNKESNND